jgi:hypothetical protein
MSSTVEVRVTLPVMLEFLQVSAGFPAYLARPDEPVDLDAESVALPVGTVLHVRGRVSVPVVTAAWVAATDTVPLRADGTMFTGALPVRRSETWRLAVATSGGGSLDDAVPVLALVAVPDSAPLVAVPLPGADTVAPISLRQAVMVDARDDHGLTHVDITSWRVSRFGDADPPVTDTIPLSADGAERALLHWVLDLNDRGFMPADTAYYVVRALDNAPEPHEGRSPVYRLRLPSVAELRRQTRARAAQLRSDADSVVSRQEALAEALADLAVERAREGDEDALNFERAEQAGEALARQEEAAADAEALRAALDELSEAAWQSGLADPEFYRQIAEIQDLLRRAVSDELRERLAALQRAISDLDPSQMREALEQLAEAAERMREELERARELFERAALEGDMSSLSSDAEALAGEQDRWNDAAEAGVDPALAREEDALAAQGDELAEALEALAERAAERDVDLSDPSAAGAEAAGHMVRAADAAGRQAAEQARGSGRAASSALLAAAQQLRDQRDALRESWRDAALAALDGAMVETADLAREQQALAGRMARGETADGVRGQQAAIREGVKSVIARLAEAGSKHALVSPRLGAALGAAGRQMDAALDQLQRSDPSGSRASEAAGDAIDALNAGIYAMLQSRAAIEGAESGTGLQEALEQMAQMAEDQAGMNGETGNLLSFGQEGSMMMQQLQALAQRERQMAGQLDRLAAEGDVGQAEALAEEAREVARTMEAGGLDRELLERQERLFRRLLDAGRSLQSDEEDSREERVSESARPGQVRAPVEAKGGDAPRYRYPTWQELRGLSPEVRRIILDYFRRLNAPRP